LKGLESRLYFTKFPGTTPLAGRWWDKRRKAMPLKQQDTDKLKSKPADTFGKGGKKKSDDDQPARDIKVGYGAARDAELNTAGEVTEEQEYAADGLPRTTKYSVDKH